MLLSKRGGTFRVGQRLGKYRIERCLAHGGFAVVYRALDTIEGIRVALKIPHTSLMSKEVLEEFRHEVRLTAGLEHLSILPLKNADFIDGYFVVVFPLGEKTLAERIRSRMSMKIALDFTEQMMEGVAYAHRQRVIHCDIKPENFILFPGNRLRLADFGIAKVALHTIKASGSGTVGFIAPEQAMGKPSLSSDVFSLGLILYRMFSGQLPEWPYEWPPVGFATLRRRIHPDFISLIRKAIEVDPRKRYCDADQMLAAFRKLKSRAGKHDTTQVRTKKGRTTGRHWKELRWRQFQREHGKLLKSSFRCGRCFGPVSECMRACPWCGSSRKVHRDETRFPVHCPRCYRGLKLDWHYCPWCYGPGFELQTRRRYTDRHYEGRCSNSGCPRKLLMPFMRYCPWCRRKVHRKWKVPGSRETCRRCGWGVLKSFWDFCPWCTKPIAKK